MSVLVVSAPLTVLDLAWKLRRSLIASVRHDFSQRYHGSLLGLAWIVIFPLLFLSLYVFVYLFVFRAAPPGGGGPVDYALFVVSGMGPYLATMDAANQGAGAIRSNIGLVRSALAEIEMLPLRVALGALVSECVGLVLIAALSIWTGRMSFNVLLLPVVLGLHALLLAGLACFLSALGAAIRDISYFVNLLFMALMFLSPIGFSAASMPEKFHFMIVLNPVYYLVDAFRMVFFDHGPPDWAKLGIFALISVATFSAGTVVLLRLKRIVPDYV